MARAPVSAKPFPMTITREMLEPLAAPINKVGLVLLRDADEDDPSICLVQVKAKNPAEQELIDFGLPKGTRQYEDPQTRAWVDARNWATAHQHRDRLEPLSRTLMNEAEQEIGLPAKAFAAGKIHELGRRFFTSRKGFHATGAYEIQWYVMKADAAMAAGMNPTPPDAHAVRWAALSDIRAMEEEGKINPCYVSVIEEAVAGLRQGLPAAQFTEPSPVQPTR